MNNENNDLERAVSCCYSTWGDRYYNDYYGPNAPYPPVHKDLILSALDSHGADQIIDAGCGPASILRHLVSPKRELYGFDITDSMILEARRIMQPLGLAQDRIWKGSVLDRKSYKPPAGDSRKYDALICIGVIPHIPREQDQILIEIFKDVVRPGGLVLLEARNELFSLFTFNRYSNEFYMKNLVDETKLRAAAGSEESKLDKIFEEFGSLFNLNEPPMRKGYKNEPGYDEILSRTHNPIILAEQFRLAGFKEVKPLFYHFHCLPPMLAKQVPKVFRQQSIEMERAPLDWRGYFMASAFIISAVVP